MEENVKVEQKKREIWFSGFKEEDEQYLIKGKADFAELKINF